MTCIHVERSLELIADAYGGPCSSAARIASELFDVPMRQLRGRRRVREICWARWFAMWAAYQTGGVSYTQIGRYFGDRDHSTVIHGIRRAEELMEWRMGFWSTGKQMIARMDYLEAA